MASRTVSWLLRTALMISSWTSCGLFGMAFPLSACFAKFIKQRLTCQAETLGIPSAAAAGASGALDDGGDTLAAADAHGGQRVPAAGAGQFVERLDGQDGAGGADGVTERDTTAVRVGALGRQVEVARHGQRLG